MLNGPEARNAQNRGMLVELNEAFLEAEADDRVRVVILGGAGKMFSAGHDMGSEVAAAERAPGPGQHPTISVNGGAPRRAEQLLLQEGPYFFDHTPPGRHTPQIPIPPGPIGGVTARRMADWAWTL